MQRDGGAGSLPPPSPASGERGDLDSPRIVAQVLAAVRGTSVTDLDVEWDGGSLRLKRDLGDLVVPAAVNAADDPPGDEQQIVRALSVGIFHRNSDHGYPEPGEKVGERTRLAEVETLGIRNPVLAGVEGVLVEVLVEDLTPVEYGQPLAVVRPEAASRG